MGTSKSRLWETYQDWIENDRNKAYEDYLKAVEAVKHSPAKYKGKPVDFLFQPFVLTDKQWNDLEFITRKMIQIIDKVIRVYLEDPSFRKLFGFSELMEQLILKESGYDQAVPVARIDLFYDVETGRYQFCEINTDGSSGMVEARELQRIIGTSNTIVESGLAEEIRNDGEYFETWIHVFEKNYEAWCQTFRKVRPEKPCVAIVDLISGDIPQEFTEFQKVFNAAGYHCIVADARLLEMKGDRLFYEDQPIDAIYRRLVSWEIIEHKEELQDFIKAIMNDYVCTIGSIRSQIPHNKKFFSILHDKIATAFLSEQERSFVEEHVPYTTILDTQNSAVLEDYLSKKDSLIIKPDDRYASHGVYAGKDFDAHLWKEILEKKSLESYLIQEYCDVPQIDMLSVEEHKMKFIPYNYLIGCFVYNGVFQGPYIRVGTQSIIGSVVECYTVPGFREKP